jgi:hypothetical protein
MTKKLKVGARVVGRMNIPEHQRLVLDHVRLQEEDYSGREFFQFCTIGSRLERCCLKNVCIKNAQFGSGREMSEFIECSCDGASLDMGPGGFARFIDCSFRNVNIRNWICFEVELVRCTFTGRIERAIFNGTVPERDRPFARRDRNEFHDNDFSGADLIDVGFRSGINLTRQRLPSGPEYLYLPNAAAAVERLRAALKDWASNEPSRQTALALLKGLEMKVQKGQQQLFLRESDNYRYSTLSREAVAKVFSVLRSEAA